MRSKAQFRANVATPRDSALGLLGTTLSPLMAANGILPVIAVAIVRISLSIESG
jgi:hypothetical protein